MKKGPWGFFIEAKDFVVAERKSVEKIQATYNVLYDEWTYFNLRKSSDGDGYEPKLQAHIAVEYGYSHSMLQGLR